MNPRPYLAAAALALLALSCPVQAQEGGPVKEGPKADGPVKADGPEKGAEPAKDAKAGDAQVPDARIAFLKDASIPVRTIDPADEDFSDLMPLIEKIGKARVVLLGEQSHGDGSCFQGKSRLIKFLHQKMGFDVLAFESGMFDMHWVDDGMRNGAPMTEVHKRGLFGIWALSAQCQNLLKYVLESNGTESPLELAGFDCQFSSGTAREEFPRVVKLYFTKPGVDVLDKGQETAVAQLSEWIGAEEGGAKKEMPKELLALCDSVVRRLDEKKDVLLRVHSPRDVAFMKRCLRNQMAYARQLAYFAANDTDKGGSTRDTAMGENLTWLVSEYYSGRKVIVWAASMHNMYDAPKAQLVGGRFSYKDTITMGHVAHGVIGDMMYSIMFIADHGKSGMPWSGAGPIGNAPKGSIDSLMHETGMPLAFVDLKTAASKEGGSWLGEKQIARPLGYAPCEAVWTEQCDAFFFTDEMKPSTMK
jgi:erythromycin esterase